MLECLGGMTCHTSTNLLVLAKKAEEYDDAEDSEKTDGLKDQIDGFFFSAIEVPHHGPAEDG